MKSEATSNFPVGRVIALLDKNHVHIQIQASDTEYNLINTNPVSQQIKPSFMDHGGYGRCRKIAEKYGTSWLRRIPNWQQIESSLGDWVWSISAGYDSGWD